MQHTPQDLYDKNIKNKIFSFIVFLYQTLSKPIKEEYSFFMLFFLFINLSTIKSFFGGLSALRIDIFALEGLTRGIAVSYCFTTILLLSGRKWLKIIFYIIALSLFSLNLFLWLVFHLIIEPQIVTFIGETNLQEATEFLSTFLFSEKGILSVLIIVLSIIISIIIETKHRVIERLIRKKTTHVLRVILCSFILLISFFGFCNFDIYYYIAKSNTTDDLPIGDPFPYDIITSTIFSLNSIRTTNNEIGRAIHTTQNVKGGTIIDKDSLYVIYILGESYIKYHSNLYGYGLITAPKLTKEYNSGNLFVFNNVISAHAATAFVVRNSFCCNSLLDKERWYDTPFFPTLFKKANFNVYYWDNQRIDVTEGLTGFTTNSFIFNKSLSKISYTQTSEKVFPYDDQLIHNFFETKKSMGKYNLIIFHLWGQHIDANSRYPHNKVFERFTSNDIKRKEYYLTKNKKQDIANYDNATYYNDFVISEVINHYRNKNSVIVYMSDHGEEIYDYRDSKGRVSAAPEQYRNYLKYQYEIPFFIWCSDIYKEKHPLIIKHIKESLNKPFMSDNVCQVLFTLSGLKTKYYVPQRDLLNPIFKRRERIISNGLNYDKLMRNPYRK